MTTTTIPTSDIDLYTDDSVLAPHENYRRLRDLGPVVWLARQQVYAVARYQEVYDALHDHTTFSSGSGVGLTEELNRVMIGSTIASDPPDHDHLRTVVGRQLTPKALRQFRADIEERAGRLADELVGRGGFDGVADFAQRFPLSVVPDLLGWPDDGREHFLKWASAGFNALGPKNERTMSGLPALQEMLGYLEKMAVPGALRPDSWGDRLAAAAAAGTVPRELLPTLLGDYLAPSLDTTISALATTLWLLGSHPDQWAAVRADHSLFGNAFNEAIRYESPVRGFSRLVTRDCELGGAPLAAGSRVLLLYGSANRDERFWSAPDTFDITRDQVTSHVAFGHGVHGCVGQGLARLEAQSLFTALAERVDTIEVGRPVWRAHNTIRAIATLPTTVRA